MAMEKVPVPPPPPKGRLVPAGKVPALSSKKPDTHDRVTGRVLIHHEQYGEHPTSYEVGFDRLLDVKEQPFGPRRLSVGEEWEPLQLGWIQPDDIGYVLIENRVGHGLTKMPTDEQIKKLEAKILVVTTSTEVPGFKVRPGAFFVGEAEKGALWIRSLSGVIPFTLLVVTR